MLFDNAKTLNTLWDGQLPVDTVKIARAMQVQVFAQKDLPHLLEITQSKEGISITYNSSYSNIRQRYFMAFAIGYLSLGFLKNQSHVIFNDESFSRNNANMRQTNFYALDLLMPERIIKFFIFKKSITTIETLAQTFGVSTLAMSVQLKRLNIID